MKSERDTHNVVSKRLLAVAGGGWCVYVFRGFGCEVEGVTGADLLLRVTMLSISFFITEMSRRFALLHCMMLAFFSTFPVLSPVPVLVI